MDVDGSGLFVVEGSGGGHGCGQLSSIKVSCAVVENASVIPERVLTVNSVTDLYSLSFTPDRRTRKLVHEQRLDAR